MNSKSRTLFIFLCIISLSSFAQSPAKQYHDAIQLLVSQFEPYEKSLIRKLENFQADTIQDYYDGYISKAESSLEELKAMQPWQSDAAFRDIAIDLFAYYVKAGKSDLKQAVELILKGETYKPKKDEMSKTSLSGEVLPAYTKKSSAKLNLYLSSSVSFLKKYDADNAIPSWVPGCEVFNKMMQEMKENFVHYKTPNPSLSGADKIHPVTAPPMSSEFAEIREVNTTSSFDYVLFSSSSAGEVTARYNEIKKSMDQCLPVQWSKKEFFADNLYSYYFTDQSNVNTSNLKGQVITMQEVKKDNTYQLVMKFVVVL